MVASSTSKTLGGLLGIGSSSLSLEDPGGERRAVRIAEYRKGHISKENEHREYVEWFVDRGERMRRALEAFERRRGG